MWLDDSNMIPLDYIFSNTLTWTINSVKNHYVASIQNRETNKVSLDERRNFC